MTTISIFAQSGGVAAVCALKSVKIQWMALSIGDQAAMKDFRPDEIREVSIHSEKYSLRWIPPVLNGWTRWQRIKWAITGRF